MRKSREGTIKVVGVMALALAALELTGCSSAKPTGSGDAPASPSSATSPSSGASAVPVTSKAPAVALPPGNPFEAMPLYVYPGTWAAKAAAMLQDSSPEEAALAEKIADQ